MPKLISDLYAKSEQLKGKNLYFVLLLIFIIGLPLGIVIGNFTNKLLIKDETSTTDTNIDNTVPEDGHFEGKVVYVDPKLNPNDEISYALADDNGKQIVLLSAKDQKLLVVEGLHVTVYGTMKKTKDGKQDVLMVEKVIARNK
ncbi:hypothetical protein A2V49_02740 [candidate division WWE3 bacterium RBG_19FT_COMBO_34_6]|uniref:Uncharacterized protein n=1 Tax=candidate division WWE3 bacterium RBG_19FT_COMBO_34_6 TaxID=1802612 RepID=A0A1F4UND8_UNCKA|nr:MAG: hypothetical protein A2V49_02740 [candidate division WWE3 bacterium RBG_19FT_COMBO_34_6]